MRNIIKSDELRTFISGKVAQKTDEITYASSSGISISTGLFEKEDESNLQYFDLSDLGDYIKSTVAKKLNLENAPNVAMGRTRFEFKGGALDVIKNDDTIQSQFRCPENFKMENFIDNFSSLKPVNIDTKSSSLINGKFDENVFQSGSTGDCWLIAALYSMCSTEAGRNILSKSIQPNIDGSATVTFSGLGVSYTITKEEIENHDTDNNLNDSYSNGDNDILVMELAVEKLWKDIQSGKVQLNTSNPNIGYIGAGGGITDGGFTSQLPYYLTGISANEYYNPNSTDLSKSRIYEALSCALNSPNCAMGFAMYGDGHSATLQNGSQYEINLGEDKGHSFAVKKVTNDTVIFVNPWDTSIEYKMSWEEFANLGIGYISTVDLDKSNLVRAA